MKEGVEIVISCSHQLTDEVPHGDMPNYFIDRQGSITIFESAADRLEIMLANLGPVKVVAGKGYPIMLDANRMPMVDRTQPPVRYFYEFCEFRPHRGWQHYEAFAAPQVAALASLLSTLAVRSITLQSAIDPSDPCPHPQPDLVRLLSQYE